MKGRYLEVTFRGGKPLAAYLYLPRPLGVKSSRTVRADAGLLIDYAADGQAIGIEITAPGQVSVEQVNVLLDRVGQPRMSAEELSPLAAA